MHNKQMFSVSKAEKITAGKRPEYTVNTLFRCLLTLTDEGTEGLENLMVPSSFLSKKRNMFV
jgi:hypothetical protein